jgi:N-ethylmaleimide reductase
MSLPNRIVMAPMTRTRSGDDGVPNELNALYYEQRASAGLIVTECTEISPQSHGILRAPGIYNERQIQGWRQVTRPVHERGGHIFQQVWHCGRVSHPELLGGELPVAPSAVAPEGKIFVPGREFVDFVTPRALETGEIPGIIEDFGRAGRNALAAGFDGVELHAAFGYLVDQFLQDKTNLRNDGYCGTTAKRVRFLIEVVEALIEACGADRVGVKLSPSNRFYGMFDSDAAETFGYAIKEMNRLQIAYLHLMEPTANDLAKGDVQIAEVTRVFRPQFDGILISNGGYDKDAANRALSENLADLISFGKPYVSNPDLVQRFKHNAPIAPWDQSTFYGIGAGGYTDYPALSAGKSNL